MSLCFEIIVYLNFVSVLLFPAGLYKVVGNHNEFYFLGHRNNSIEFIIPALLLSIINLDMTEYESFKRHLSLLVISNVSVFLTWSANAIIAIVSMDIFCLVVLCGKEQSLKILNYWLTLLASIIATVYVVIFRLQAKFEWLISGVLKKSLTITNRTRLWDNALYYIAQSPLIGWGKEFDAIKLIKIGHVNSAHNYYLDILYSGGLTLFIIYILIVIITGKTITSCQIPRRLQTLITSVFTGFFIVWFATPMHTQTTGFMFMSFYLTTIYLSKFDKPKTSLLYPKSKHIVIRGNYD
jgi:O-antigen ligase